VHFASRQLKQVESSGEVEEQQIYDYVLDWKKTWKSDEKKESVASAIRNLVVLGWMKARISESMIEVS
jgi:hypothetical protein